MAQIGEHLFWPVERWLALQEAKLGEHLRWAGRTGLYKGRRRSGIDQIGNSLEVLKKLPFTTKEELAGAGSAAWAVAPESVAEWVCTSGTSGRPLDVPLTRRDLERLAENEAVALGIAGVRAGDLVLLAVGMDRMFVAGLAYWLGARKLGATCMRVGALVSGHPRMLAQMVERAAGSPDRRVFVIAVPSFLTAVEAPQFPLQGVIAIGEPVRGADLEPNPLGRRVGEVLRCPVMSTYALTETCATFAEGPSCRGGHLNPELGVVEVVEEAGAEVAEGEIGEVVVTPLGVEGMPLVRFRTGDMAALYTEKCACGRTTPRLGPIVGRRHQLLKVRGTNIYPNAILEALRGLEQICDCAIVAEREAELSDRLRVYVQVGTGDAEQTRCAAEKRLRSVLRVTPEVLVVGEAELKALMFSGGSRKAQRFIDRR